MLDEFILKRKCNVSNVFIFETSDPKRINQFIQFCLSDEFSKLMSFKAGLKCRVLLYDMQCQTISDPLGKSGTQIGDQFQQLLGFTSANQLLETLKATPTILIVKYVYERRHAEILSDLLVAASHDDGLYAKKSTIAVFTCDASLFPSSLLRLVHTISIPPSTVEERAKLLDELARKIQAGLMEKYGQDVSIKLEVTDDLIQASAGLTLHEVETAALESFYRNRCFCVEVFTEFKVKVLNEMGLTYIRPTRGFESVGGYDYLKNYIRKRVIKPLREPETAKYYGLGVPRGILLYGPPGCGKTWLCKALAAEVGLPMITLNPSDILRGIVGETEMRVRQITRIIESLAPVILFIDEFDQLTLSREAASITDSGVTRRMTNMLLEWLGSEDRKTFVVGATNFVEHIDSAFLRPGRLDEVIPVLPPDYKARFEILKVHTSIVRKVPVEEENVLKDLAEQTEMWTGAELEKLVIEASLLAMDEGSKKVTPRHFKEAMDAIEVNYNERQAKIRQMIQSLKKLENVNKKLLKEALKCSTPTEEGRIAGIIEEI